MNNNKTWLTPTLCEKGYFVVLDRFLVLTTLFQKLSHALHP